MKKYVVAAIVLVLAVAAFLFYKSGTSPVNTSASAASSAAAINAGKFSENIHYRVAGKVSKPESGKIQVQEFFWYGCPHCQNFEPAVREYKNKLADDVELIQIPVTWNEATGLHAAVHYVAMESEDPEPLQDALFEKIISIRKEGNLEKHIELLEPVFEAHGISADKFRSRLGASDIQDKVSSAASQMRDAGISGTPSIMVDGTWVVLNNEEVAGVGLFSVVDYLIEQARVE